MERGFQRAWSASLGNASLLVRNLEISDISTEILRSVVSQYYIALVLFDVTTAEE